MTHLPHPTQNRLLAMLAATGDNSFFKFLQLVDLPQCKLLFKTGQPVTLSYFPITAAISTVYECSKSVKLEVETIRNDGVFGLPPLLDNHCMTSATVQCAGQVYCIEASLFKQEIARSNELLQILLKYVQFRMTKIAQIAVCSRFHSIEQQLCRVLLNILDYSSTNSIEITQQIIANKLNVRRESITQYANNLQRLGIISMKRGSITILNRSALEKLSCECYQVVAHEAQHLLSCPNRNAPNRIIIEKTDLKDLEYRYVY